MVHWIHRLYSLVSYLTTFGMRRVDYTCDAVMECFGGGRRSVRGQAGSRCYIQRSIFHRANPGKTDNLVWMLYSVDAVPGVNS